LSKVVLSQVISSIVIFSTNILFEIILPKVI
jgi:hypothetical protein